MESECTFEALSFLFPERQRASLVAWREEAVKRERKHASRRQQQLLDLQHYVADRLMQLRERQQPSAHNTLTHSSSGHRTTPTTLTVSDEGGPIKKFDRTPSLEPPQKERESVYSLEVVRDRADKGLTADHSGGGLSVKNSDCPPLGDVYVKVTALGRGFLTRRLLQSAKISSLIQTIKDGGKVLAGISEPASDQDKALCDRVHTQLQLARMTLLNILELPVGEKMSYIAHSRLLREQKMGRKRVLMGKVASHGRLSLATQRAIERRQKSSATISASQPRKQVHKPPSLQERSKLQQDRPGRVRGPRLDPVPHSKVPSQTLRPPTVAVQDKIKARQNKTTAPLRVLGRNAPRDRASQSEHDSKLGQVKSGHQRQTGRHRPRTQPLPTHLPEQMTKKSKTRTIPSQ